MSSRRFDCVSGSFSLSGLLDRTRKLVLLGLGLSGAVHLSLARISGLRQEREVPKPLTTQFVKRQPRLTKPLELKKRPQPKRRAIQRQMVSVKAKPSRQEAGSRIAAAQLVQGLSRPQVMLSCGPAFLSGPQEPEAIAQAIQGSKEAKSVVDVSLEMLDIEALNTGRYHALVVQDPSDKRNLKGYCRLSVLYIPRVHNHPIPFMSAAAGGRWFECYVVTSVHNLAKAMNRYTSVKTDVLGRVQFGDKELFKIPWIFTYAAALGYRLADTELSILGEYLMQGGFVVADGQSRESYLCGG